MLSNHIKSKSIQIIPRIYSWVWILAIHIALSITLARPSHSTTRIITLFGLILMICTPCNFKFCARTFGILTVVFGKSTMSRTQVQLWYNRCKEDRENVNDDARPCRSSTSITEDNIKALKKRILYDYSSESLLERMLIMLANRSSHTKQFL